MGKIKHLPKIKEFLKKTPVFSARDIELLVKDKRYCHLLLHNLFQKKEIFRLQKGCYSVFSDPIFAVFCFKPAYLGLQEALSLHNLWEQETNPVILTLKKVREGVREILGSNVVIYRLPPSYFFGFELLKYDNSFLPVSDLEKTLIDFFYFKQPLAKETLSKIKRKIDKAKLDSYLNFYPKDFRESLKLKIV
jgi:predicted transcriptional regulator of viral defense system